MAKLQQNGTIRKEAYLLPEVVAKLEQQALTENRTLKNHIETILTKYSNKTIIKL